MTLVKSKVLHKIHEKVKKKIKSINKYFAIRTEPWESRYLIVGSRFTTALSNITFLQDKNSYKHCVKKDCRSDTLMRNEIKILKRIGKNEHIIKVIEILKSDIGKSIIFERAYGDLCEEVSRNGRITLGPGLNILLQLLDGLMFIHEKSVIHRDIKLENIVCFKSQGKIDRIKIIDFGLASVYKKKYNITDKCGTPGYMAPEIINEMPQTFAVDLWATGVVICIMYCRHNPFNPDKHSENETVRIASNLDSDKYLTSLGERPMVNIIRSLLHTNPLLRPSASDCRLSLIAYSQSPEFQALQQ